MAIQDIELNPTVRRKDAAAPKARRDLGRILLWPLERLLPERDSPESSAATVMRLFESAHVKDLRLIAGIALALALYGSVAVFLLSLESVIVSDLLPRSSAPIPAEAASTAAAPSPLGAIETSRAVGAADATRAVGNPKFAKSAKAVRAAQHWQKRDFWTILHLVLGGFGKFLKNFAAPLGVLSAVIAWAYQRGSARLGVVDLFACEISTLCRVATLVDTAKRCIEDYETGWDPPEQPARGAPLTSHPFSSSEDYFPIFGSNSRDLQSLEARVVINITAFYTYMKAVRDMRRSLQSMTPSDSDRKRDTGREPEPGSWREAMRNQIYMLFLALESARKTIEDLVEFEPEQAERTIIVLVSELEAYGFLCAHYTNENDLRRKRLLLRMPGYIVETRDSIRKVEEGMASPDPLLRKLWAPAGGLLDELRDRRNEALSQASDDPALGTVVAAA
jgi:hypothetical protein